MEDKSRAVKIEGSNENDIKELEEKHVSELTVLLMKSADQRRGLDNAIPSEKQDEDESMPESIRAANVVESNAINTSSDSDVIFEKIIKKQLERTIDLSTDSEDLEIEEIIRDNAVINVAQPDSPPLKAPEKLADPETVNDPPPQLNITEELADPATVNDPPPKLSTTERVVKDVPEPEKHILTRDEVFDKETGLPKHELLKQHFLREGRVKEDAAVEIVKEAAKIMRKEDNLIFMNHDSITIVGDIHGQYYDLMTVFEIGGSFDDSHYLFLGDYVDRGQFSIECVLYLFALKIVYKEKIILLRGNHECRHLTEFFSFKAECITKLSVNFYEACMEAFDCLPLAAIVKKQFFCVHGGLSPDIRFMSHVQRIKRFREPPTQGPMCDLLWSDPAEDFNDKRYSAPYARNEIRGCSWWFSYEACEMFLKDNNLLSIIRAHEAQERGFTLHRHGSKGFPALITLFSAPNYLDVYGNKAAVIKYKDDLLNMKQFGAVEHPYWLPGFANAFEWSLPFAIGSVTQMFGALLNLCPNDEIDEEETEAPSVSKRNSIQHKIKAVAKMSRSFTILREKSDIVLAMKGLSPDGKIPYGAFSDAEEALKTTLQSQLKFDEAKRMDRENEKMPPEKTGE